ncbi:MFS transporter [Jatrophihabitans telluris]|uniref:MFS transporter n=1 Tax=Jatrophihabitans telluris TaxID=2038343 RepID=A0ABY4R0S6_9ACTN|nr:MFS transporter [Jatrophihabitans telluris]UQX89117.1 MFS transporter [Jatrophihabitans telluris]
MSGLVASTVASPRRWLTLAVGLLAQAATCAFLYGLPMLVPQLRSELGLSLSSAGAVVAAPGLGLLLTLIAWGAVADRFGERWVIVAGMGAAGALLVWAGRLDSVAALCAVLAAAGAGAASVNAASGRLVLGWFAPHERGLAMGIRQTGQPLGVAYAALVLPPVAHHGGLHAAFEVAAATCLLFAVLVGVLAQDPPRGARGSRPPDRHPYRVPTLWRLHAASTMLVVPQFAVSGFSMIYLVSVRHWDPTAAGRLLFCAQLLGAAGRIGSGVWSDRVHSRLRPMRQLAVAATLIMAAAALGDRFDAGWVIAALVLGAVITVADNGLAFTAVAEIAGPAWAGRALGAQNTAQNIAATLTPPLLAGVIASHGYSVGFAVAAAFPILAIALTPVAAERTGRTAPQDTSASTVSSSSSPRHESAVAPAESHGPNP